MFSFGGKGILERGLGEDAKRGIFAAGGWWDLSGVHLPKERQLQWWACEKVGAWRSWVEWCYS